MIPEVEVRAVVDEVLLDVREAEEFSWGRAPNAVHIPLYELPARLHELPEHRPLSVICKVGARSAQAAAYLLQQGRDVVNLDGGMLDWEAAGREMVSETGQPPLVV